MRNGTTTSCGGLSMCHCLVDIGAIWYDFRNWRIVQRRRESNCSGRKAFQINAGGKIYLIDL